MRGFESHDDDEMLVAYVYGETPPDFAAIVACGFEVVGLDRLAPWFGPEVVEAAKAHGLLVAAWPMSYVPMLPRMTQPESPEQQSQS